MIREGDLFQSAIESMRSGNLPQAEARLREVLGGVPRHLEAQMLLGVVCARTQRFEEADERLTQVLAAMPQREEALVWLSMVKRSRGLPAEGQALARRALAAQPNNPVTWNELGLCLMAMHEPAPAVDAFIRAIQGNPRSSLYALHLGLAYRRLDELPAAKQAFEQAIRLDPSRIDPYLHLFEVWETGHEWEEAASMLVPAIERFPSNLNLRAALARCYTNMGDSARAEAILKEIAQADTSGLNLYGRWLQEEGRFPESVEQFKASLRAEPKQGNAIFHLTEGRVFDLDGKSLAEWGEPLLDHEMDTVERTFLRYGLAKTYEHEERFEDAMRLFDEANAQAFKLYNAGRPFDRQGITQADDRIISSWTPEKLAVQDPSASESEVPVFIVGMIRSGTTLLDQILSSHSEVATAGEPVFWPFEFDRLNRAGLSSFPGDEIPDVIRRYTEVLRSAAGDAPRVLDKMPLNYPYLGLIHSVYPKAKFIHVRRSPIDTCLSIYTTYFSGGPNFAYDKSNIVFHYLEYMRLMEHWRHTMPPSNLFEVDYEAVVQDREGVARKVLQFLGLPWDEACLHHDQSRSAIRSPSRYQAKQPIYRRSLERWRNYEPWLGSFRELLNVRHPEVTHGL